MFNEFGAPKFIEVDFSKFIVDQGDAGLGFVEHVFEALPQAISHVHQVPLSGGDPGPSDVSYS